MLGNEHVPAAPVRAQPLPFPVFLPLVHFQPSLGSERATSPIPVPVPHCSIPANTSGERAQWARCHYPPGEQGGHPQSRRGPGCSQGSADPVPRDSPQKAPSPCTGLVQHPGRREGHGPWEPKITKSLLGRTAAGSPAPRTRPDSAHTPPGVNLGAFCKHFPGCGATRQWGVTPGICTEPGAVLVWFFFYFPP